MHVCNIFCLFPIFKRLSLVTSTFKRALAFSHGYLSIHQSIHLLYFFLQLKELTARNLRKDEELARLKAADVKAQVEVNFEAQPAPEQLQAPPRRSTFGRSLGSLATRVGRFMMRSIGSFRGAPAPAAVPTHPVAFAAPTAPLAPAFASPQTSEADKKRGSRNERRNQVRMHACNLVCLFFFHLQEASLASFPTF